MSTEEMPSITEEDLVKLEIALNEQIDKCRITAVYGRRFSDQKREAKKKLVEWEGLLEKMRMMCQKK